MNDRQCNMLDMMSVIGFLISVANYSENLDQSTAQDIITKAVHDIHAHLEEQDRKIDELLRIEKGGETIETEQR